MAFLNSCVTYAPINDQVQCSPLITLKTEDNKRYIDEDNSTCTCRLYRISEDYIGQIGDIWNEDVTYCSKLIGFPPDNYGEFVEWLEADRLIHKRIKDR